MSPRNRPIAVYACLSLTAGLLCGCANAAGHIAPVAAPAQTPAVATSPSTSAAATTDNAGDSPAPTSTPIPAMAGKTVAIDPGHDGGNEAHSAEVDKLVPQGFGQFKACDTTGADAADGYSEHEFNFQVSLLVKALLEQHGVTVVLTRATDTGVGPCVDQRAAIGNQAHANAAVSVHADGNDTGHGYQLLEANRSVGGSANDARSHQLSVALHTAFDSESGLTASTYAGVNGYEPRDDIAGLNLSTVPKVLVECGNMHDPGDLALEQSPAGRRRIAGAIADGILAFLAGP